jgi:hypothetical protein
MIDAELAAFVEGGQSIHVCTRDALGRPHGVRGVAARVDGDRRHVDVYIPDVAFVRLKDALASSGQAAMVFCRPTDDRACQVKGTFVGMRAAQPSEQSFAFAQWDGFMAALDGIGISPRLADRWVRWPAQVLRVEVTAIFEQTPGPRAGTQLS